MTEPRRRLSPTQELRIRVMRIVRACPDAAADVLELMFLVSRIEALTQIDTDYRDARRLVSRLRDPLWDMAPADRRSLRDAAEVIRRACALEEADIPATPIDDLGERERVERGLSAALAGEFDAGQIARVTGAVATILQR